MKWENLGYIKASKYRKNIVFALSSQNKTPIELKKELKMYMTHVSSTLKDLESKGIVECLTPDLRKGKIYTLTEIGQELYEYMISN